MPSSDKNFNENLIGQFGPKSGMAENFLFCDFESTTSLFRKSLSGGRGIASCGVCAWSGMGDWSCSLCTFDNHEDLRFCEMCGSGKAVGAGRETGDFSGLPDGMTSVHCPIRMSELYGCPVAGIVGSYGGGDDMQMSRQLCLLVRPVSVIPDTLRERVFTQIDECLWRNSCVPEKDRVAHLPNSLVRAELENFSWSCKFQISSHVYGCPYFNLMYHGHLFEQEVCQSGRQGAIKYPLIGFFDCFNIAASTFLDKNGKGDVAEEKNDQKEKSETQDSDHRKDPAWVGINSLQWADTHIHKVGQYWHFGSDMARFRVMASTALAGGWAVCVDIERRSIDAMYMLIVTPELEGVDLPDPLVPQFCEGVQQYSVEGDEQYVQGLKRWVLPWLGRYLNLELLDYGRHAREGVTGEEEEKVDVGPRHDILNVSNTPGYANHGDDDDGDDADAIMLEYDDEDSPEDKEGVVSYHIRRTVLSVLCDPLNPEATIQIDQTYMNQHYPFIPRLLPHMITSRSKYEGAN